MTFDASNNQIPVDKFGKLLIEGIDMKTVTYERFFPAIDMIFFIAVILAVVGFFTIWILEKTADKKENSAVN